MTASRNVGWDTCAEDDCIGIPLPSGGKCWAHAEDGDLDTALKRLSKEGTLTREAYWSPLSCLNA